MLQMMRKSNLRKRTYLDLSHRSWNESLHEISEKMIGGMDNVSKVKR